MAVEAQGGALSTSLLRLLHWLSMTLASSYLDLLSGLQLVITLVVNGSTIASWGVEPLRRGKERGKMRYVDRYFFCQAKKPRSSLSFAAMPVLGKPHSC